MITSISWPAVRRKFAIRRAVSSIPRPTSAIRAGNSDDEVAELRAVPVGEIVDRLDAIAAGAVRDVFAELVEIHCGEGGRVVEDLRDGVAPQRAALQLEDDEASVTVDSEEVEPAAGRWQLPPDQLNPWFEQLGVSNERVFELELSVELADRGEGGDVVGPFEPPEFDFVHQECLAIRTERA